MTITTDHKWKDLKYRYEVPEKVLVSQFDHIPDECDGFFQYRGTWYHTSDFMRTPPGQTDIVYWSGYFPDSFYSAVLLNLSDDYEQYQVGTYIS